MFWLFFIDSTRTLKIALNNLKQKKIGLFDPFRRVHCTKAVDFRSINHVQEIVLLPLITESKSNLQDCDLLPANVVVWGQHVSLDSIFSFGSSVHSFRCLFVGKELTSFRTHKIHKQKVLGPYRRYQLPGCVRVD